MLQLPACYFQQVSASEQLISGKNHAKLTQQITRGFTYGGGPGSVVGIATGCGLDGPAIESRWG